MSDVLDKLKQIGAMQSGDMPPDWVNDYKSWGTAISQMCIVAADELERWRKLGAKHRMGEP